MMNQKQRILQYIRDFGSITPLEAIRDIGVLALSQRIGELKRDGAEIGVDIVDVPNRYGGESRVARYSFEPSRSLDAKAAQAGATSELDCGGTQRISSPLPVSGELKSIHEWSDEDIRSMLRGGPLPRYERG